MDAYDQDAEPDEPASDDVDAGAGQRPPADVRRLLDPRASPPR